MHIGSPMEANRGGKRKITKDWSLSRWEFGPLNEPERENLRMAESQTSAMGEGAELFFSLPPTQGKLNSV